MCGCVGKYADDRGRSNRQDSSQVLLIVLEPVSPSPLCVMSRVLLERRPETSESAEPSEARVGTSRAALIRAPLRADRVPEVVSREP